MKNNVVKFTCDFCDAIEESPKPGTWVKYDVYKTLLDKTQTEIGEFDMCPKCQAGLVDRNVKAVLKMILAKLRGRA